MSRQLTEEQKKIVSISQSMLIGESLKIQACAGSGKTSTLVEISKANPNSTFLYLAFNKSIVEEAKNKFPDNVNIKTTHSLAYSSVIAPNKYAVVPKHTFFDLKGILGLTDYEEFYQFSRDLNFFLNSNINMISNPLIEKLFESARNGDIAYTHSMYLKEYQMLSTEQKMLNKYDFILLDEAQDTNGVTLGIFLDNQCRKIVVGDTFQNIYGFRDTVNALERLKTNYEESLTYSFRSKQSILSKACYFLNKYSDTNKNIWFQSAYEEKPDTQKTQALITRTNAGIINTIAFNLSADEENMKKFKLIKEPDAIFAASMSCYHLKNRNISDIHRDYKWISKFNNISDLEEFATLTYDVELLQAIKLVEDYDKKLFDFYDEAKKMYRAKEFDIYLTNAHISKGLEWDIVTLKDDFIALSHIEDKLNEAVANKNKKDIDTFSKALQQEVNLYYVALTRAKDKVIDKTDNNIEYTAFISNLKEKQNDNSSINELRQNTPKWRK